MMKLLNESLSSSVLAPPSLLEQVQRCQQITLSNGARLLVYPMPDAPRIAVGVYVTGGNLLDAVPGQVDLIDRLLTQGTVNHTAEELAIALDSLSVDLDVSSYRDYSLMGAVVLPEDWKNLLHLMGTMLFRSTLVELPKEAEKLRGEIAMELDSPRALASDALVRQLFDQTPYGTVSSVMLECLNQSAQLEPLTALYQHAWRPENLVIVVAGPVTLDAVADELQALFAPYEAKPTAAEGLTPEAPEQVLTTLQLSQQRLLTQPRDDANQAHIFQAWLAPALTDADMIYPLSVMNTLLGGGGLSSRLFIELRDKQGLAYHVRSGLEAYRYRGMFSLYIGTEPSNIEKCLNGFREECQKLMDTPVGEQELAETKRNLLGKRTVFLETPQQWVGFLGQQMLLGRSLEDVAAMTERVQAVTPADIQKVAQQVFSQFSVVSVVAPKRFLPQATH